jgi:4'-phosphopantetheinyl transferase
MTAPPRRVCWYEQRLVDVPSENSWLTPAEHAEMERFKVPKRRSDWRLGRWTAKCAASAYVGWPKNRLGEVGVVSAPSGAPTLAFSDARAAPEISISHSNGVCVCLIGEPGVRIGCDIERVEMRTQMFLETFLTHNEVAAIRCVPGPEAAMLATLIWSAKESYLKAIREGLRRDTKQLEVTVPQRQRSENKSADYTPWLPFWIVDRGTLVLGSWRSSGVFVETAVELRDIM